MGEGAKTLGFSKLWASIATIGFFILTGLFAWRMGPLWALVPGILFLVFLVILVINLTRDSMAAGAPAAPAANADAASYEDTQFANKVIQEYRTVLKKTRDETKKVRDLDELPYDKATIKKALTAVLLADPGGKNENNILSMYLELAKWQSGDDDSNNDDDDSDFSETTEFMVRSILSKSTDDADLIRAAEIERGILKMELQQIIGDRK